MIQVTFNGPLKRPWPQLSKFVDAPPDSTVSSFLQSLDYSDDEIQLLKLMVNKIHAAPDTQLNSGDELEIFLVVGGG